MVNYCIPVLCPKSEIVLKVIEENSHLFQFFEVWLGAIENLDDAFLGVLLSLHAKSLVVLFRKQGLEIPFTLERRQFLMREMDGSEAYLDLDIVVQKDEVS